MPRHSKRAKTANQKQTEHSLRIIGGKWRGSKLTFYDAEGLRPTGDRARETLFNWLAPTIAGANCLDLFAGSGALGFEALSRGASKCTFVESNPKTLKNLQEQAAKLHASGASFTHGDALKILKAKTDQYDIFFIDPPFSSNLAQASLHEISANSGAELKPGGLIYLETAKTTPIQVPPSMLIRRKKTTGNIIAYLIESAEAST